MKFTKNTKLLIVALALVAACIVVYRLSINIQISPAPPALNINSTQPDNPLNIQTFSYVGTTPTLPATLDVYQSLPTIPTQELVGSIANILNLTSTNRLNVWENTLTSETLSLSSMDKSVQYLQSLPPNNVMFTDTLVSSSIEAGKVFLNTIGFGALLSPDTTKISFYEMGHELYPTTKTTANLAVIPFAMRIAGYPVYFENTTQPPAVLWVDSTQRIIKAEFFSIPPNMSKLTSSETYNLSEVMDNLKNGEGVLIATQLLDNTINISDLESAEFDSLIIEYRFTESDKLYFPYFHFTGTGKTKSGESLGLKIITPAVK